MLCICYLFLCIASLRSFVPRTNLIELSLLALITTGLMKFSSEQFSNFIICFSSNSLLSSFSTLFMRCNGTLRPLCCVGLKYCLNLDFAMWCFERPNRLHRWGNFEYFACKFLAVMIVCSLLSQLCLIEMGVSQVFEGRLYPGDSLFCGVPLGSRSWWKIYFRKRC